MLLSERVDYVITLEDPFSIEIKAFKNFTRNVYSSELEALEGWPIAIVKSHPKSNELYKKIKSSYEVLLEKGVIKYENKKLLLSKDHY